MERKMPTLQHKVHVYIRILHIVINVTAEYRASGGVCGEVLEYGVGVWTTHYCHAHTVCGGWKGIHSECNIDMSLPYINKSLFLFVPFYFFQIKCVWYWPEKLHDSVTLEDKFHVTYSSNMPFAEYEIRKFKLQNVSITEPHQQTLYFPCSPSP